MRKVAGSGATTTSMSCGFTSCGVAKSWFAPALQANSRHSENAPPIVPPPHKAFPWPFAIPKPLVTVCEFAVVALK